MNTQWSLDQASTHAGSVDTLFLVLVAMSAVVIIGVVSALFYFVLKYRRGQDADRTNPVETHHKLELTWTIIPLVLSLGVFVWAGRLYFQIYDVPQDAMEIYVVGKQWMWKFQHPDTGIIEVNDLHVPMGRAVKLTMTSEDVIHSLFIPAFRVKTDVLPGRYTSIWFEATEAGSFHLFCAEYCGTDHAGMGGQVIVMPEAEYTAWAAGGGATQTGGQPVSAAQAGGQIFTQTGCGACHKLDGTQGIGPSLVNLFGKEVKLASGETVTADEAYLRNSILEPATQVVEGYQPVMPPYAGQLNEDQILQLIAYIKSLTQEQGGTQ